MSDPKQEKSKKRKNILNLVKVCCFVIVLLVYLFGIGEWFRRKGSAFDSYYDQPDNTIDVIMVGRSHVYSGYIPAVLWKEYGISSYNVYGWSIPMWTAYYYTKEALRTQDVDVVFLDVGCAVLGAGGEDTYGDDQMNLKENMGFHSSLNRYELLLASSEIGGEEMGFGGINDLTLYHNNWKDPESLFTPYEYKIEHSNLRNFGALYDRVEMEVVNINFYKDMQEPVAKAKHYLDKFVRLAEKENFRLVFILTPYTADKHEAFVFNWMHQYADENDIDFIDFFREPGQVCGIDLLYDMSDYDHVRFTGAVKLTRYLGDYLREIGYQPREHTNVAQLDEDAEKVYSMLDELYQIDAENAAAYDTVETGEDDGK